MRIMYLFSAVAPVRLSSILLLTGLLSVGPSYGGCSKEETLKYVREGFGKEQIQMICEAGEPSPEKSKCCCVIVTERKNADVVASTAWSNNQTWDASGAGTSTQRGNPINRQQSTAEAHVNARQWREKHEKEETWILVNQEQRILPAGECGKAESPDYFSRTRSHCEALVTCTGQ